MLSVDAKLIKQLKDAAEEASRRKCKNVVSQMFSIELCLIKNILLPWFNKKIKSQNLQIDLFVKNKYEKNNPINWAIDLCSLCKFPLNMEPLGADVPNDKMSYGDFYIRYEHKFLRNIYSKEQLQILHKFQHSKITIKHTKNL